MSLRCNMIKKYHMSVPVFSVMMISDGLSNSFASNKYERWEIHFIFAACNSQSSGMNTHDW